MTPQRKLGTLITLRIGEEDARQLEAIAERERTSVSAVVRRFIAEGLDVEARRPEKGRKKRGRKS